MSPARVVVERATHAFVQDLGRPGFGAIGVPGNGACDQHAARTANVLVGNAQTAPLIEITGSEFAARCDADALVAVTGAAEELRVDGHPCAAWELVPVEAGSHLRIPLPARGLRSYLAVNGIIEAPRVLGSVAPDLLLGFGRALKPGDELSVDSRYALPRTDLMPFFRLGARRPVTRAGGPVRIDVTPGPDLGRLTGGPGELGAAFQVLPDSDYVGLRLSGPPVTLRSAAEFLSRGVPTGAVEVVHSGALIVLLRGRLVTAGYPVVAVATTASLDALGQLRSGDAVSFSFCSIDDALSALHGLEIERRALAGRVRAAFAARGIADALSQDVLSQ